MKKFLYALLCAVFVLCAFLCACGLGQIEDTNGESDTSLCSITDEEILGGSGFYSEFGAVFLHVDKNYTYSANKLSGVKTLASFTADDGMLCISYSVTLQEGNLRIVLLRDGEYVQDLEIALNKLISIENLSGKYTVRVAGESAKVKINLYYDIT